MKNNELKTNNTVIKNIKDFLKMPPTIIVIFIIISLCFVLKKSDIIIFRLEGCFLGFANFSRCIFLQQDLC